MDTTTSHDQPHLADEVISATLNGQTNSDVEAHLSACGRCSTRQSQLARARATLVDIGSADTLDDLTLRRFVNRAVDEMPSAAPVRKRQFRRPAFAGAAAAALITITAGIAALTGGPATNMASPPPARTNDTTTDEPSFVAPTGRPPAPPVAAPTSQTSAPRTFAPGPGTRAARYNIIASPENGSCRYTPGEARNGGDLLTVSFFLLEESASVDPPQISVTGTSDTGLRVTYETAPDNRTRNSGARFALRPEDFGRTHTLTLTADPAGRVAETSESDNHIRVTVRLPSPRPTSPIDPLPCSMEHPPSTLRPDSPLPEQQEPPVRR